MNAAFTVLVVLIIIAAILLIAVVLLQNGKDLKRPPGTS